MSWNNQGGNGGPWGTPPNGGNNNPWNRPNGSNNGPQPPDLEELLRKGSDHIRRAMPGGTPSRSILLIGLFLLVSGWLVSGFYRVEAGEQGIELTFGRVSGTPTQSGLRYHWPYPIQSVMMVDTNFENELTIGMDNAPNRSTPRALANRVQDDASGLMLTADENVINIDFKVRWRIQDPQKYLFRLRDPQLTVARAAESAMREIIGVTNSQAILTGELQEIQSRAHELLQQLLDSYDSGIVITAVNVQKAEVPEPVKASFFDVQNASQDRETKRNEAEAYRNKIIPEARGEAERLIQEAEAYREQVVTLAKGDAQRFMSVYEAFSKAKESTSLRMYLEMMEQVLGTQHKIIVDPSVSAGQGVLPYLPLNELPRGASGSNSNTDK